MKRRKAKRQRKRFMKDASQVCHSFGPADEMTLTREERERLACIPDMEAINNTAWQLLHPKEPKADADGNIDMAKYFGGYMNLFSTSDK